MKATVKTKELKEVLRKAKKCISKDLYREPYNNIQVKCDKEKIEIISIDGFRVSINECETMESGEFECIVPCFSIPKNAETATILELKDNILTIDFGVYKISYQIIPGSFTNYKQFIYDQKANFEIGFNAKLLKEALEIYKEDIVKISFDTNNVIGPVLITNTKDRKSQTMVLPCKLNNKEV